LKKKTAPKTEKDEKSFRAVIKSENAPKAIGPYSQAIRAGNTLYLSGSIGIDPKTGDFKSQDIEGQTTQVLENLRNVLQEAGATFDDVVKTTVLLKSINDYAKVNAIYGRYFGSNPPARAAYAVGALPRDALIEIEIIAVLTPATPRSAL